MQTPTKVPGVGAALTTIIAEKGVTMSESEFGIVIAKGTAKNTIPWANVKVAEHAESSKAK